MTELNRRDFILATAATTLGACMACPLHAAPAQAKKDPVDVGVPADFPRDGVHDRWAKDHAFFVVRKSGRLYAVSLNGPVYRFVD